MSKKQKNAKKLKAEQSSKNETTQQQDDFPFIKQVGAHTIIEIMVKPNAKTAEIQGVEEGLLKVAIDAPPVDGKANSEVISFMSKELSVKKSSLAVIKGQTSHHKTLQIESTRRDSIVAVIKSLMKP